nr:succinylglutamate desuccinylase/aspartoacylase family protein [Oceaniglobus ichthyenteri]
MTQTAFEIGGVTLAPGERRRVELPVSVLSDHTPVTLSVQVIHGKRPGPVLFVSAAVHGDEVIGVEIARRLLRAPQLRSLAGTLMVVPIVNSFGFLNNSRYMPDRRDLNRVFPGSPTGSLAARLAHLFMSEVVARADFGIDLHSAAIHRTNMPQIRVSASNETTLERAEAFGAPIIVRAKLRDGSLRAAAREVGCDILLYEAGEALRFDELSARVGSSGILRVMHQMGMIGTKGLPKRRAAPIQASSSSWLRAPAGGLLRCFKEVGEGVEEGTLLAAVADPFGEQEHEIIAPAPGIILGRAMMPVINEGDACYHIAATPIDPQKRMERLAADLEADPMFDEDEIL